MWQGSCDHGSVCDEAGAFIFAGQKFLQGSEDKRQGWADKKRTERWEAADGRLIQHTHHVFPSQFLL